MAVALRDLPLAAFDSETTGADPLTARLVTAVVARIDGPHPQVRSWLADPGVEIPAEATAIHGVSTEHARAHGRPHDQVAAEVAAELGRVWAEGRAVVVFNASYDLTVLTRHVEGFAVSGLVVDPFVIDRAIDPYRKGSRKLADMCAHYNVRLDGAHDAQADALGAARLAWKLLRRPELEDLAPGDLMAWQQRAHKARQDSFAEYLRRVGKDASDVCGQWPVRSAAQVG